MCFCYSCKSTALIVKLTCCKLLRLPKIARVVSSFAAVACCSVHADTGLNCSRPVSAGTTAPGPGSSQGQWQTLACVASTAGLSRMASIKLCSKVSRCLLSCSCINTLHCMVCMHCCNSMHQSMLNMPCGVASSWKLTVKGPVPRSAVGEECML